MSSLAGEFWAEVEHAWTGNFGISDWYAVRDQHGKLTYHPRRDLHRRVWVRKAYVGFSDDRKHDSWATQHFLDRIVAHAQHLGKFSALHLHSDNAAQHFKNSKSKNWLSLQLKSGIASATWSYGCPGHGVHAPSSLHACPSICVVVHVSVLYRERSLGWYRGRDQEAAAQRHY